MPDDLRVNSWLVIPAAELHERFSRSSGPGGQSVNTADSRVELSFDVEHSAVLPEWARARALERLASRLSGGTLTIAASEQRSQLANRQAARARLVDLLHDAIAPPPRPRVPTRPGRAANERRLQAKRSRAAVKRTRRYDDRNSDLERQAVAWSWVGSRIPEIGPAGLGGRPWVSGSVSAARDHEASAVRDCSMARKMADLFDPEPGTWGLRGDPYLWRALREHLSEVDVPESAEGVARLLNAAFAELAGLDLTSDTASSAYRAQYAHGGMSSGMISLDAWRHELMPMLVERARLRRAPPLSGAPPPAAACRAGAGVVMQAHLPRSEHQIPPDAPATVCLPVTTYPSSSDPINYVVATTTHTALRRCHNDVVAASRLRTRQRGFQRFQAFAPLRRPGPPVSRSGGDRGRGGPGDIAEPRNAAARALVSRA